MSRPDRFDFDVFIGYAAPDRVHAEALCAALRAAGLRVFIDLDMLPGDDWTTTRPDALERSRIFVWVISPRSPAGWYDKDEGARAIRLQRDDPRRRLIPVRLGEHTRQAYGAARLVSIDVDDPPDPAGLSDAARGIVRAVMATRDAEPQAPASAAPSWLDPPDLPPLDRPYPVLGPYTHPALFAGRDVERDDVLRRLRARGAAPVTLLYAPSGAGKSSLLRAGLLPGLRGQLPDDAEPVPVALVDDPHQPGLVHRLLAQLVAAPIEIDDHDGGKIADAFAGLPEPTPLCVLDQFEEIFKAPDAAARARVGLAIAATVLGPRRSARWLLVYRDDYHGRVRLWLRDVLAEARAQPKWSVGRLRHDLDAARALADVPLPLFGAALTGEPPGDAARAAFTAAIERPLAIADAPWPWQIEPRTVVALAAAFAEARIADLQALDDAREPAPLVPELQVVLARLMAHAAPDHILRLPASDDTTDDPPGLTAARRAIDGALRTHLDDALTYAIKTWRGRDRTRARHLTLVALKLLTLDRRRGPARTEQVLAERIETNAEHILATLADPGYRVLVQEAADDPGDHSRHYRLSHDRMAEAVNVEIDALLGNVDEHDPLRLEDFVLTQSALFARGEADAAELNPKRRQAIAALPAAFVQADDTRSKWWAAVDAHARKRRRQRAAWAVVAVVAVVAITLALGWWVGERRITEQLASTDPATQWLGLTERVERGAIADAAVAGLPTMDNARRRALIAETFPADLDPAVECALRRALIDRFAPAVRATADFGALLAAADRLTIRAVEAPGPCATPAAGARVAVVAALKAIYGEPPESVRAALHWQAIPPDPRQPTFACTIGSPPDEPDRDADEGQRTIELGRFEMSRTEVTNAMFAALWAAKGATWRPYAWPGVSPADLAAYPANVDWYDAAAFAAWVGGRLPTEAEWECAARAGSPYAYPDGSSEAELRPVGWYVANSDNRAHPVGGKAANGWGLRDVHGNVWEWTADWYGAARPEVGAGDPLGPAGGEHRVLRGGSFANIARNARSADRNWSRPDTRDASFGFRVARPTPALDH